MTGGFDLAADWMGWINVFQVEINPFCQKVLEKNFPTVKRYGDIKEFDGTKYRGAIDILTGGFPCQPFSYAGARKQKNDDRYLWPEMLRVIRETKPKFIIAENVSGVWGLVDEICSDLENEGYKVEPVSITSGSIGSDNIRERYWFVAYPSSLGWENVSNDNGTLFKKAWNAKGGWKRTEQWEQEAIELDTLGNPFLRFSERYGEPAIFGNPNGLSKKLDPARRLKSIGNAIDPRIAFEIFKAINFSPQLTPKE